jgi:hypothetical protein
MCISLTTALLVGSAVSAVGSIAQGRQQQRAYDAQADATQRQAALQAEENRRVSLEQAAEARRAQDVAYRTAAEEDTAAAERGSKVRRAAGREVSRARAAFSASGVVSNAGSAVAIQDYIDGLGEADAMAEITEGTRRARALRETGDTYGRQIDYGVDAAERGSAYMIDAAQTQGDLYRKAGVNSMFSGALNAGTSLLGGYLSKQRLTKPGWKSGYDLID